MPIRQPRRSPEERFQQHYRILLHNYTQKCVGQAQWRCHLRLGNLTRQSTSEGLFKLLENDNRLALVAAHLIAYEDEFGALIFETRRRPELSAPISLNIQQCFREWLYQEPTLPQPEADRLMRALRPRIQIGDPYGDPFKYTIIP